MFVAKPIRDLISSDDIPEILSINDPYNIIKNKEILSSFCEQKNNFSFTDFAGNYCLLILPVGISSNQVVNDLQKEGIYTMNGLDFPEPIEGVLRIHTGGKPEFMQKTVDALKRLNYN